MTPRHLRRRTSVHYPDTWVKQPRPPAKLSSALHRQPPPPRPAYAGRHGGKRLRFCVNPTGQPVHRPTAQLTASRYRMAMGAPPASGVHRPANRFTPTPGESSGWPARQEHGLTLCRNPYAAGPASSLYVSYGPCSSVPASGCHHRAVPNDPTGLPEQALNLFLLAASPSGTRKTRTKSHALRSQAVAPTTWNPAARTIPRCPLSPVNFQSSIANRPPTERSRLPNDNGLATTRPPAAALVTGIPV